MNVLTQKFGSCLIQELGAKSVNPLKCAHISAAITSISANSFKIEQFNEEVHSKEQEIPLGHNLECPAYHNSGTYSPYPSMLMGACVIVENSLGEVLLTRRPAEMDIFSRAFVVPGGHVEEGELPHTAAARELLEEAGVDIPETSLKLSSLWESCYPTVWEGTQKSHHIVAFFHAIIDEERPKLSLQEGETDMAVWISKELLLAEPTEFDPDAVAEGLDVMGNVVSVPLSEVLGVYPNENGSGVAEGHLFALKHL